MIGVRRSISRRRGATLVEYVSMMAIGAAVLAGGAQLLGGLTSSTFESAALSIPSGGHHDNKSKVAASTPIPPAPEPAPMVPWWGVGLLTVLGGVGLVAVQLGSKKKPAKLVAAEEPEQLPVVPERLEAQFIAKRQQILQVLDRELWCVFDGRIIVQDILTECPTTVRPDTPVERVQAVLHDNHIHQVLVVDMQGHLLGMVSERECHAGKNATAGQVMTKSPETIAKTVPVVNAISLMLDRGISSLPVVEDGRVLGIVTSTDMLMTLQCCIQLLQRLASTMWQPGMSIAPSWDEQHVPANADTSDSEATGRFFDVMKAMSESQQ